MMSMRKWIGRLVVVGALGAAVAVVPPPASSPTPVAVAQTGPGAGGEYHAVPPQRVFDSRPPGINDSAPLGKKPMTLAGSDFEVQVTGLAGVPADPNRVLAVVANVTVVEPEQPGWLAVRPSGAPMPNPPSSLVNFAAGRDVPNTTIVGVGSNGRITVRLRGTGSAHVIVDVSGWISTSSHDVRGARLVPVGPARLTDTRNNAAPLRSGQTLSLPIRGATSYEPTISNVVPNRSTVSAVMVNLVAINWQPGSRPTYVTATPTPIPAGTRPTVSNVNLPAGMVKTNMAIVPIGPDGRIHLYNFDGDLHLAVDVLGYFETIPDASSAGRIVPLDAPFRALDTREPNFGSVPLGGGTTEDWSFSAFAGSVQIGGLAIGAQSALIGNFTATDLSRVVPSVPTTTYLTAFPAGGARPLVSNINLAEGEVVPNMSLVTYGNEGRGSEAVKVYNHDGSVHYVLDVYAVVLS